MGREVTGADIRLAAMDLLSRREHGVKELETKLARRFRRAESARELIGPELVRLQEEGLLSDDRYAQSVVRNAVNRGQGPLRLRQTLRAKGIEARLEELLSVDPENTREDTRENWRQRATQVFLKKFGDQALPEDPASRQRERARRARFMQYRGFETEHFVHLLDGVCTEE